MYEFIKVGVTEKDNKQNAAFLAEVFNNTHLFTEEYIKWQYADHPMGQIMGYNAIENDKIASHFVLQQFPAIYNNVFSKGLLAFNTATHKDHRGKGLFINLAKRTIEDAIKLEYEFIVAVTNHNSKPGFVKHLGFQEVCQLKTKIGIGKVGIKSSSKELMFEKFWNDDLLKWRMSNPLKKYFSLNNNCYSRTHISAVKAFLLNHQMPISFPAKPSLSPFILFIGVNNDISFSKGLFFNIPEPLKPSPLFLIFRDLKNNSTLIDQQKIKFNLIDFDAY